MRHWSDGGTREFCANTEVNPKQIRLPLELEWLLKFEEVRRFGGVIYIPLMNLKAEIHFEIYRNDIVSTIKNEFAELFTPFGSKVILKTVLFKFSAAKSLNEPPLCSKNAQKTTENNIKITAAINFLFSAIDKPRIS